MKEIWTGGLSKEDLDRRQQELSNSCYTKFLECEQRSLVDRINKQRKDLRFYDVGQKKYPSITSIISWDKDFFISQEQLVQYAARGTIVHKQIEVYIQTGIWKEAKDIPELHPEYVIVRKGSLNLDLNGYHISDFIMKFQPTEIELEKTSYNHDHLYAGRYDVKCTLSQKRTLIDWKTSKSLDKKYVAQQLAAHMMCPENDDVEQLMAVPINNTTKQGFSTPLTLTREEAKPFFDLFLKNRANFKQRFGV